MQTAPPPFWVVVQFEIRLLPPMTRMCLQQLQVVAECDMPKRSSKLPRDPNQLVAHIVAMSTGTKLPVKMSTPVPAQEKNPAAVALGRLGGIKGGKARAESLTPDRRGDIARRAAAARWSRKTED